MTRIIDTPKALLLEVPEGSYWFELDTPVKNRIVYALEEKDDLTIDLPTGYAYDQPMLAGEMGEEEISEIVEYVVSPILRGYRDYDSLKEKEVIEAIVDTPCQSFASLLRSYNMKPETTVVIPKKKNP